MKHFVTTILCFFLISITSQASQMKSCDTVTLQNIAEIMKWDANEITAQPVTILSKGRNISVAFYLGQSYLSLQTVVSSERAIENRALDRKFDEFLNTGENGIAYTVLPAPHEDRIFGHKTGDDGVMYYVLRQRWGVESQARVELASKSLSEKHALEQLHAVMDLLN